MLCPPVARSLAEALGALVDQTEKPKLKVVLSKIRERVNEGATMLHVVSQEATTVDLLGWCTTDAYADAMDAVWD